MGFDVSEDQVVGAPDEQMQDISGRPGSFAAGNIRSRGGQTAVGHGAFAAHSMHFTTYNARDRRSWSAVFARDVIDDLTAAYAPAPSDYELDHALGTHSVVYLIACL
jgi:hypothetical protein